MNARERETKRRQVSGDLSRRRFLALSTAGLGVASLAMAGVPLPAARAQEIVAREFSYEGSSVRIETSDAGPRIVVDGRSLTVVDSNGAYRAPGSMYSPEQTLEGLARRTVENRAGLSALRGL